MRWVVFTVCLCLYFAYRPLQLSKTEIPFQPSWETPSIAPISPFTYFAEGTQSYVFLSKDRKVILKLFKQETAELLEACKLAYDMSGWTQVLSIHLNPKPNLSPFIVRDRWGIPYSIDPAKTRFILQRKVSPFFQTLRQASPEERSALIASFYTLLDALRMRGIANLDNSLGHNFGFLDGKAVAVDFGKFVFAPEKVEEREAHFKRRLDKWLLKSNKSINH